MIKQVYTFEAASHLKVSEQANKFLENHRAPLVHEIQYQTTWDDNGIKHHILVVLEEQEKAKNNK